MKKAQISGQIFIYILAAIIFAMVLIYGYRAVGDFLTRSEQVAMLELKTDLSTRIKSVRSTTDVERLTLRMPSGVTQICFLDLSKKPNQAIIHVSPLIYDSWASNVTQDVFLVPQQEVQIYVGGISIDQGFKCFRAKSKKVDLRLEGIGDGVKVSGWGS